MSNVPTVKATRFSSFLRCFLVDFDDIQLIFMDFLYGINWCMNEVDPLVSKRVMLPGMSFKVSVS